MKLDSRGLECAGKYVDECAQYAEIHTVTLTANGQHGGVDVKIEGTTESGEDYLRIYVLGDPPPWTTPPTEDEELAHA